ncbi:MAG: hypothetical protein HUK15_06240, partial [Bacteroidales bacterium]|nr:hypothetical protein [Bacteroidales bacterium]
MLRLLKSNNPVNYIVAFMLMLALWAYRFIAMPPTISVGAMNSYFFPVLFDGTFIQYLLASAAFILTFAFASYLAKANFKYQIVGSGYQIPTIFFVILSGMLITAQSFIPEQIASFL